MSRRRIKHRIKGMQIEQSQTFLAAREGERVYFACGENGVDLGDFQDYMEAHKLMPYNYLYDPDTCRQEVCEAIAVLHDVEPSRAKLLRAIAILGHSPCLEAVEALNRHRLGGGPFAGAAEMALSECCGMFGQGCGGDVAV